MDGTPQMALLSERAVIRVSGPDAAHFLNGLISNGVDSMRDFKGLVHAALLTPQGKILFEILVWKWDEEFYLDCVAEGAADLVKRLTFYKLRAKVEIADVSSELGVAALWDGRCSADTTDDIILFADPRRAEMGARVLAHPSTLETFERQPSGYATRRASREDYHAHRIACGVAELGQDFASGEIFPHEANFDKLHGIDFKKGCYVGQEVVSRMQHRGTARSRFVKLAGSAPLPGRGSEVRAGDVPLGTTGSHVGTHGLALLRLDRWQKAVAAGHAIAAAGLAVEVMLPDWLDVPLPASEDSKAT